MAILDETRSTEYSTVHAGLRDAERIWQTGWMVSMLVACMLLAWGISTRNPGLMIPVMLAVALGFTSMFQGRRDARLMAGYLATYAEKNPGDPRWFTRLGRLSSVPGFSDENDWILVGLANAVMACAVTLAWWFAPETRRGEIIAGVVSGAGVVFLLHSISQVMQMHRTTAASVWRHAERMSSEAAGRDTAAAA